MFIRTIFPYQKFCIIKNNPYLCIAYSTSGRLLCWVGLADILFIGVYRRFVLMFSKLRNFQKNYIRLSNVRCPTGVLYQYLSKKCIFCTSVLGIIIYQRGLRVVVLIQRAMREPQIVERQLSSSTFFYVYL